MMPLAELQELARIAAEAVKAEVKRLQDICPHGIDKLELEYSGVSSYSGNAAQHGVSVRCECGLVFPRMLTIHND